MNVADEYLPLSLYFRQTPGSILEPFVSHLTDFS